ncbi:unnamed protein product [Ophioblennius macclurei]
MLQPEFLQSLKPDELLMGESRTRDGGGQHEPEEGNPFCFTPQLIHLHKDHELFEDGDITRHMYLQDLYVREAEEDKAAVSVSQFACHISGCSVIFSTLEEYEHHYNSLHRHVCCSCRRSLPSARLLDIHIQEWHDSLFTILSLKQDMYQCLVEGCEGKFRTSKHRKDHLITIHKYPPDFRFDKPKKDKRVTKRHPQKDTHMEAVDDICESEGVCEVMCKALPDHPDQEESMETQVSEKEAGEDLPAVDQNTEQINTAPQPSRPQYSYRVPPTVCFGHGSIRGFRGRRGRRK